MIKERRTPIRLTRKGPKMGLGHRRQEPTTNVASQERKSTRQVKKDIRVDDAKAVRGIEEEGR
jgi:hypothetical protein